MAFREGLGKTRVSWPFRVQPNTRFSGFLYSSDHDGEVHMPRGGVDGGSCTEEVSNRINVFYDLVKYEDRGSIE
jgi:hypothetical protein